jgi:hypothetical protein
MTKVGGQEVRLAAAHKTRLHPHSPGGAPAGASAQSTERDQLMGHVISRRKICGDGSSCGKIKKSLRNFADFLLKTNRNSTGKCL